MNDFSAILGGAANPLAPVCCKSAPVAGQKSAEITANAFSGRSCLFGKLGCCTGTPRLSPLASLACAGWLFSMWTRIRQRVESSAPCWFVTSPPPRFVYHCHIERQVFINRQTLCRAARCGANVPINAFRHTTNVGPARVSALAAILVSTLFMHPSVSLLVDAMG